MLGIWCINGLAQSFLWPPLVKLMSLLFTHEGYKCVSTRVTWGTALGTVSTPLEAPLRERSLNRKRKSPFGKCRPKRRVACLKGFFLWEGGYSLGRSSSSCLRRR